MTNDVPKFESNKYFVIVVVSGDKKRYIDIDGENVKVVDDIHNAYHFNSNLDADSKWENIRKNSHVEAYDYTCVAEVNTTVILSGLKKAEDLKRKDAVAKLTPYEKKILGIE